VLVLGHWVLVLKGQSVGLGPLPVLEDLSLESKPALYMLDVFQTLSPGQQCQLVIPSWQLCCALNIYLLTILLSLLISANTLCYCLVI